MENLIDEESTKLWNDSKPSIHFNYVDKVTYKGVSVLQLRTDIAKIDLLNYINGYYRVITADRLLKNLQYLDMSSIRQLRQYNGFPSMASKNYLVDKPPKAEITYNYKSMEQVKSFQKPNACKFIAFKLLSESVPLSTIPIDSVQMNWFGEKSLMNILVLYLEKK